MIRHSVRSAGVVVVALAILALNPVTGLASTVGVSSTTLEYSAGAGEPNNVSVSLASDTYTITDPGAAITANAGCNSNGTHQVICAAAGVRLLILTVRDGNDAVSVSASTPTIIQGGSGNDTLVGGAGVDFLDGDAGNDSLGGGDAGDLLTGGAGADFLSGGGGGFDTASYFDRQVGVSADIGGDNNDGNASDGPVGARDDIQSDVENIYGGDGNDVLTGDAGRNTLSGGPGSDTLNGGDGDDSLSGDTGADSLSGGGGADFVSYAFYTAGVTADIGGGANDGNSDDGPSGARDDIQSDVENITGSAGSDLLIGDAGANVLDGSSGGDVLNGLEGQDSVLGADGNDELHGGPDNDLLDGGFDDDILLGEGGDDTLLQPGSSPDGADTLGGGDGNDTADYSFRTVAVVADPGGASNDGQDTDRNGVADEGDNVGGDVENVIGGSGNDTLAGDEGDNRLQGGGGNDSLNGRGGSDLLISRDAFADSVVCGDGLDSVIADGQDSLSSDCELVDGASGGGGSGSGQPSALQSQASAVALNPSTSSAATAAEGAGRRGCAGLKGRKLKQCKALKKCKKLRGAKKRRCKALARCKGLKAKKRKSCLRKARRVRRR